MEIRTAFQGIMFGFVNDLIMPMITIRGLFKEIEDLKAGPFNFGKIIPSLFHFWSLALIPFRIIKANNRFTKNKKEAS